MDAFTARLGSSQGRIIGDDGIAVFVLGDADVRRSHDLAAGDYAEIAQTVDLTGVAILRVRGTLRAPAVGTWRVILRVAGVEVAHLDAWPGRTRSIADLGASVANLTGLMEIAIRLTLVAA